MILSSYHLSKQAVKSDRHRQEWFPVAFSGAFWGNELLAEGAPMFNQYVVNEWMKVFIVIMQAHKEKLKRLLA